MKKIRRRVWLGVSAFKNRKRPARWKWERRVCCECNHVRRYKVYATWEWYDPSPIDYDKFLDSTMKGYSEALLKLYEARGGGYITGVTPWGM